MKIFPNWRAVGRAMRWARRERLIFTNITDGARFEEMSWRRDGAFAVLTATGGDQLDLIVTLAHGGQVDASDLDAIETLRVLAALDLIPAELTEPSKRYGRCATCGRVAEWVEPTAQFAGRWCHLRPERPYHVPVIPEPEVQPQGQATGSGLCRCSWLGGGTPEHERGAFCRPDSHTPTDLAEAGPAAADTEEHHA